MGVGIVWGCDWVTGAGVERADDGAAVDDDPDDEDCTADNDDVPALRLVDDEVVFRAACLEREDDLLTSAP